MLSVRRLPKRIPLICTDSGGGICMKITDAVWEKRNLGVSCCEITVYERDRLEEIAAQYATVKEKDYMVVKIASSNYMAVEFFQENGYRFAETAVQLVNDLGSVNVPKRLERICSKCTVRKMTEEDIPLLHAEIDKGIFSTDRISVDPHFTRQQAAERYKNWIGDLISSGCYPYAVNLNGEDIGFFLNREKEAGVYDGILAAAYAKFGGTGMGYCVQYAGIRCAMENGAKKYLGHISGNNPAVMKVLTSLGFLPTAMEYVFVKHNS